MKFNPLFWFENAILKNHFAHKRSKKNRVHGANALYTEKE